MASSATNSASGSTPDLGKPQFSSHEWLEPILVLSIMIGSLIVNRRRGYRIIENRRGRSPTRALISGNSSSRSPGSSSPDSERLLSEDPMAAEYSTGPKTRSCCGITTVQTPDNSKFVNNIHSRVLAKFPFLIEMFYWALNFLTYALTKAVSAQFLVRGGSVLDLAREHGLQVLWVEHDSFLSFLFPIRENEFQAWFLNGHTDLLTTLNRIYSLVHIPGSVTFLSWYYFAAPSFSHYAVARRTMTLGNFAAFFIFTLWPCMPPRLLPDEYGFHDTVRQDNAESVFVGAAYVNQLAAMPSLHFTYAFVTGCTLIYHSSVLPFPFGYAKTTQSKLKRWPFTRISFFCLGVFYPLLVLTVIVATANHYFLDACVAMCTVTISLCVNKAWYVLLPAEDWFAWCLRVEKPRPTTNDRWCVGGDGEEMQRRRRRWKEQEEA